MLAVVFLIDMILIWSFPDGPPAFLRALDVIAWIVWASFAVDYIARLLLSGEQGRVRPHHKLDLLMVLLPMLRLLRVFLLHRVPSVTRGPGRLGPWRCPAGSARQGISPAEPSGCGPGIP